MKSSSQIAVLTLSAMFATGCAGTSAGYQPIVDGPADRQYQNDLNSCQRVAHSLKFNNGDVRSEAVAGALIGAVVGAIEEGGDGALVGAALGAGVGGAGRAWEVRDERKDIVLRCMENRGHNVVG